MLDMIFWGFMGIIGNIVKFIIVFGIIGFILLLPFLLNGGWLLGIFVYGYLAIVIFGTIAEIIEKGKDENENRN